MSLLLNHTLPEAMALMMGEVARPSGVSDFPVNGLNVLRLRGLEAAPGHAALDSDSAWKSIVRGWWGLNLTWGLCISSESREIAWNLLVPAGSAHHTITAHLTGARLDDRGDFSRLAARLQRYPFRSAMAGHSATGLSARLEPAVRSMVGRNFIVVILAKAALRDEIEGEIRRLDADEQFIRDEHLARPSLERESHTTAARFVSLVEAARERASAALQEGGWHVRTILAASNEIDFQHAQSLMQSAFAVDGGKPEPVRWQDVAAPRALTFLRTEEVAALTRPPQRDMPGFLVETRIDDGRSSGSAAPSIFATDLRSQTDVTRVAVGRILADNGEPDAWMEIATTDLCRHLLVAGMTGSGKTTTCEHLLLELWREHRIPWLVIEPGMKTGYRRLLNSEIGSDIEVWAVGAPHTRRLPLNPMAAPVGMGLSEHTSGLFAVIASAFELVPPMPEVLATAIEQTYRNHGWDLNGVIPDEPPPALSELVEEIDRSSRKLGYGAEVTANIRAGLLLRLKRLTTGPLAPELTARSGPNVEALVARPKIIELSALPDADSQALVLGLIALQLRHHWRMAGQSDSLRHVTLIEEAHRLLRAIPETAANASRTRAVEDLANLLAEVRAMGAGIVVVDQTPSALVHSAVANTGSKILHRLDHPADRELVGRAAGLPADQVDLLGALRVGDAIFRSDRGPRPFRLRIPNPAVTYGKLPLPKLPADDNDKSESIAIYSGGVACVVCRSPECAAELEGKNVGHLRSRLESLQAILPNGEEAVWNWALRELAESKETHTSPTAPLCFLIAISRAAGLPESTIQRLRTAFESRMTSS